MSTNKNDSKWGSKLQYIGNLDIEKIGKYKNKISTTEVILTDERMLHIY